MCPTCVMCILYVTLAGEHFTRGRNRISLSAIYITAVYSIIYGIGRQLFDNLIFANRD
jgi:hypothetical protein